MPIFATSISSGLIGTQRLLRPPSSIGCKQEWSPLGSSASLSASTWLSRKVFPELYSPSTPTTADELPRNGSHSSRS